MMFAVPEEFSAYQKAHLETLLKFTDAASQATEEWIDLNMKSAKAAAAESLKQLRALAVAKDVQELASLQSPDQWNREREVPLQDGISGLQAKEYGLVVECADSLDDVVSRFHIEEEIATAQRNSLVTAIERLATQAWLARTLLFIAFFALISEASSPGLGVAGFVSGLCFLLFFFRWFLNFRLHYCSPKYRLLTKIKTRWYLCVIRTLFEGSGGFSIILNRRVVAAKISA